ncbi:hypothetical protein DL95DRAFT_59251 [Leptodontidium sp. 2 PMI_412]|nr:hypothetical protein DL95DRAFT_59251 [Leptodontidium sp. 2 PMI_412]
MECLASMMSCHRTYGCMLHPSVHVDIWLARMRGKGLGWILAWVQMHVCICICRYGWDIPMFLFIERTFYYVWCFACWLALQEAVLAAASASVSEEDPARTFSFRSTQPQPQQPLKNMFLFPSSLMYNDHLIFSFMSLIHVSGYVSDFVAVSVSLLSKRRICIALHYI